MIVVLLAFQSARVDHKYFLKKILENELLKTIMKVKMTWSFSGLRTSYGWSELFVWTLWVFLFFVVSWGVNVGWSKKNYVVGVLRISDSNLNLNLNKKILKTCFNPFSNLYQIKRHSFFDLN